MIDQGIQFSVAIFLLLFFAGSGYHKLQNFNTFKGTMEGYGLVPSVLISPVAAGLVVAEFATALLVVLPGYEPVGALLAITLLGLYALVMGVALMRGLTGVDCGCSWGGSKESAPLSMPLIGRNLVLILLAALAVMPGATREIFWMDWVTAFMASGAVLLMYQAFESLVVIENIKKENYG